MGLLSEVETLGAYAPQLWPLEAVNALSVAERRGRLTRARRRELVGFLRRLPIEVDGQTASEAGLAIADLAEACGLSAYDAAYLELAARLGLPLATTDTALRRAAAAVGVRPLPTA